MKHLLSAFLLLIFLKTQCYANSVPTIFKKPDIVTFFSGTADKAALVYKPPVSSVAVPTIADGTTSITAFQNKVFTVKTFTSTAIQASLDSAHVQGGGEVYAPDGVYLITAVMTIGSNTKLALAPNAIFKRNANINSMLINKHNSTTGGYGQATNIEITGGMWDLNKTGFESNVTGIATGHANYIYIHDTKMINGFGWHFIELNATQHAIVKNVVLKDLESVSAGMEMMQIDLMLSSAHFPWFGPYDNTPCDDVLVEGCVFINGGDGIGSISAKLNFWHTNIKIVSCHFVGMRGVGISMNDYQQVIISANTFTDCWGGIYVGTVAKQPCKGYTITGNIMQRTVARGIHLTGSTTTNRYLKNIVMSNNTIMGSGRHGIGADYCENVTVTDNQVHNNGGTGIWLYRSNSVVANGNSCYNNNLQGVGVGDFGIGSGSGIASDTQHILFSGNQGGSITFYYTSTNKVVFTNNIIATKLTTSGTKAEQRVFNNYIAGVWTL